MGATSKVGTNERGGGHDATASAKVMNIPLDFAGQKREILTIS
jgi:hypothetical protein